MPTTPTEREVSEAYDRLAPQYAELFADAGVTGIIELAPAGALTGLAKRALRGVPSVAVKTPDDLQAAVDLIEGAA